MVKRIVVIGGGFAGVKCAKTLRQKLNKSQYEIILFASENHMVFHPLLAEVASASINPKEMAAPLRGLLRDVQVRMEEITEIDLEASDVWYQSFESGSKSLKYDELVIACGNSANLSVIPGMIDHAFPLKTVADALALQLHVINQMERAEICADDNSRKHLLTFVVVGGGFSGVEIAGELHDFISRSTKYYSKFSQADLSVTLVHTRDQILPEVSSSLREFARQKMEKSGIRFFLDNGASFCTVDGLGLNDGSFIHAGTVICTIGTRPAPVVERLCLTKASGRIVVLPDMSIEGFANAWAIGDCASIINNYDGNVSPSTAQFAERQGTQAAHNIVAKLSGNQTKPFCHRSLGTLCSIGGRSAVAEVMGLKFSGLFAWMIWRGTYLCKLPSLWQQISVGLTWLVGLFAPPALSGLRTDQTRRVGNAHYRAGDWIFKAGQPATDFYVIKSGEVEVVSESEGKKYVLAQLGTGDFFGESALMESTVHRRSCRAKTDVELVVLGNYVFEQISSTLKPLRAALAEAIIRRRATWEGHEELKSILDGLSLTHLIEPITSELIDPSCSLRDALTKMTEGKLDVLYVIDGQGKLVGLVTRTDLMMAVESSVDSEPAYKGMTPVKAFMLPHPLSALQSDNATSAILCMREHGFKRLPVVDSLEGNYLVGTIRAEKIVSAVIEQFAGPEGN